MEDKESLFIWCGQSVNINERNKAGLVATLIKNNEKQNKATLIFCNDDEQALADFHSRLSGSPADIQSADDLDSVFEQANKSRAFSFNEQGTQCQEISPSEIQPSVSYVLYENNELKIVMQCEATREMRHDMFVTVLRMNE